MVLKRKKKGEGPFKANRILDTSEVKVDQVFTTHDGKPVAIFITNTEEEARRIGAEGYVGPTRFGAGGEYDRDKRWVTRAIYFPKNLPGARFDKEISNEMRDSVTRAGTMVPEDIPFEKVEGEKTYPISGAAVLQTGSNGYHATINGKVVLTPPGSFPIMKLCPSCGNEIHAAYMQCPFCGNEFRRQ